jgi:hypothetical protein
VAPDPAPTLTLALAPDGVVLAVGDRGTRFDPQLGPAEPGTDEGFGLWLVDQMADRLWVEHDAGTRVVCELSR